MAFKEEKYEENKLQLVSSLFNPMRNKHNYSDRSVGFLPPSCVSGRVWVIESDTYVTKNEKKTVRVDVWVAKWRLRQLLWPWYHTRLTAWSRGALLFGTGRSGPSTSPVITYNRSQGYIMKGDWKAIFFWNMLEELYWKIIKGDSSDIFSGFRRE